MPKWYERVTPEYIQKNSDGSPEQRVALVYANQLHDLLHEKELFPLSTKQGNPDILPGMDERELSDRYIAVLPEYEHTRKYASDKVDFQNFSANIGYKMHLNVPISRVQDVASYLQREGFCHKYLSGGEVMDGKIFTLYTGSRIITERMAQKISDDLGDALMRPVEHNDEREMAPNISGRFNVSGGDFVQYGNGLKGIPMLREDAMRLLYENDPKTREAVIDAAFKKAFIKLKNEYGEYFLGS